MTSEKEGVLAPEQYYAVHQKAFRTAFDFLTNHFPPEKDTAWWEKTANDVADAYMETGQESLAYQLLRGVYEYLDKEWKRRYLNESDGG